MTIVSLAPMIKLIITECKHVNGRWRSEVKTLKCYLELNVSAIALDDFVECLSLYNIPGIVTREGER